MIIVHSVIEENIIHIINTADTALLEKFAKFVLVHEDFLVLLMMNALVKNVSFNEVTDIDHVSFDFVLQLTLMLIEDMHLQYLSVVTKAIMSSHSEIFVQGSLKKCLEIFGISMLKKGLKKFINIEAKAVQRMLKILNNI